MSREKAQQETRLIYRNLQPTVVSPDAGHLLSLERREMSLNGLKTWDFLKRVTLKETFWMLWLINRPSFTSIYDLYKVCFISTMISMMN